MRILCFLLFLLAGCQKSNTQTPNPADQFEQKPLVAALSNGSITEASGIADSKLNKGYCWVLEDSGNPPQLYLLRHDGLVADSVMVDGAVNRDWEDMARSDSRDDGKSYLYIGDIGDNNAQYPECVIYRLAEPVAGAGTVTGVESIRYRYPDGPRDAEALLIDHQTQDIYIVTKRDSLSRVYRLPYPQSTDSTIEATYLFELPYNGVVAAATSPDGREIILKTYTTLYYYAGEVPESPADLLRKQPVQLGYQIEAQGEAVSFGLDNNGFFTLSEEVLGIRPTLNFYRRK